MRPILRAIFKIQAAVDVIEGKETCRID
jgi:hypothetical protein